MIAQPTEDIPKDDIFLFKNYVFNKVDPQNQRIKLSLNLHIKMKQTRLSFLQTLLKMKTLTLTQMMMTYFSSNN